MKSDIEQQSAGEAPKAEANSVCDRLKPFLSRSARMLTFSSQVPDLSLFIANPRLPNAFVSAETHRKGPQFQLSSLTATLSAVTPRA